ncbi:MAG TPA: hypothetical protein VF343_06090 [Syntrophales bacterium]
MKTTIQWRLLIIAEYYGTKERIMKTPIRSLITGWNNALIDPQTVAMVEVGNVNLVSFSLSQR